MLASIRLFHNFCTIVKERYETRRTKYRRMISQFCRDQLNCLPTNQPKDDRTFRASTSIISCVRARAFYAISVVDDDRYFKNTKSFRPTREVLSTHHICYERRQPKYSFLLMKNKILNHASRKKYRGPSYNLNACTSIKNKTCCSLLLAFDS